MSVAEIIQALPTLSHEELVEVRALVESLAEAQFDAALKEGAASGVFDSEIEEAQELLKSRFKKA